MERHQNRHHTQCWSLSRCFPNKNPLRKAIRVLGGAAFKRKHGSEMERSAGFGGLGHPKPSLYVIFLILLN